MSYKDVHIAVSSYSLILPFGTHHTLTQHALNSSPKADSHADIYRPWKKLVVSPLGATSFLDISLASRRTSECFHVCFQMVTKALDPCWSLSFLITILPRSVIPSLIPTPHNVFPGGLFVSLSAVNSFLGGLEPPTTPPWGIMICFNQK